MMNLVVDHGLKQLVPPEVSFDNPNTTITNVTVPNYGIYEFSFQGCDTISSIVVGLNVH